MEFRLALKDSDEGIKLDPTFRKKIFEERISLSHCFDFSEMLSSKRSCFSRYERSCSSDVSVRKSFGNRSELSSKEEIIVDRSRIFVCRKRLKVIANVQRNLAMILKKLVDVQQLIRKFNKFSAIPVCV